MPARTWDQNSFQILALLGKGSMGAVHLAREKLSSRRVALKIVLKTDVLKLGLYQSLKRQIELQSKLLHPSICRLYGYFHNKTKVYMVQELCGKSLFSLLQSGHEFTQPIVAKIIRQLASALAYLNERHIVHRDVKLENVLVVSQTSWQVKLADFGSSIQTKEKRETLCGTLEYLAPEVASRQPYGASVDIWCLGVLTYELLFNKTPFQGSDLKSYKESLQSRQLEIPEKVSGECMRLLKRMLEKEQEKRPNARQVERDAWLRAGRNKSVKRV